MPVRRLGGFLTAALILVFAVACGKAPEASPKQLAAQREAQREAIQAIRNELKAIGETTDDLRVIAAKADAIDSRLAKIEEQVGQLEKTLAPAEPLAPLPAAGLSTWRVRIIVTLVFVVLIIIAIFLYRLLVRGYDEGGLPDDGMAPGISPEPTVGPPPPMGQEDKPEQTPPPQESDKESPEKSPGGDS